MRKLNRTTLRDKVGRESGEMVGTNWRSRPLCEPLQLWLGVRAQANVTDFLGRDRSLPWLRSGSQAAKRDQSVDTMKKVARIEQTNREAESRPMVRGFEPSGRTQSVCNR